jgi:hypothetical protein
MARPPFPLRGGGGLLSGQTTIGDFVKCFAGRSQNCSQEHCSLMPINTLTTATLYPRHGRRASGNRPTGRIGHGPILEMNDGLDDGVPTHRVERAERVVYQVQRAAEGLKGAHIRSVSTLRVPFR